MNRNYRLTLLIVVVSQLIFLQCKESLPKQNNSAHISSKVNFELQQTANFIGGLPVDSTSPWFKYTKLAQYQRYKKLIAIVWQKYYNNSLSKISHWRKTQLNDINDKVIFYPFSGPDIINPLTFFPRAKEYIMLGLERVGVVPDAKKMNPFLVRLGMQAILPALGHILGRNYFITSDMLKKVGRSPFNGIAPLMMLFIARLDYQIIQVDKVELNAMGKAEVTQKPKLESRFQRLQWQGKHKSKIYGVRIRFKKKGSHSIYDVKTAYFFSGDASDTGLSKKPEFFNFILTRDKFFTLLKASSYLMFNKEFDDIRSVILARSTGVLQGASGLPFHFFNNSSWNLSLYGEYFIPIRDFTGRCQPDMVKSFNNDSRGALPFSYDYHYKPGKSNMVIARRAKNNSYFSPQFDFKNKIGVDTYCIRRQFLIRKTQKSRKVINASPYKTIY